MFSVVVTGVASRRASPNSGGVSTMPALYSGVFVLAPCSGWIAPGLRTCRRP